MKYKTAFRLALKVVGVFLLFQALPSAAMAIVRLIHPTIEDVSYIGPAGSRGWWDWHWPSLISEAVSLGTALYLFFGGRWIVDLAIPSNQPYCHECG